MTEQEVRRIVADVLSSIAPEADISGLVGGEDIREALDIDSFDFLNVVIGLHQRTGIDIPETDYPKLYTLDGVVGYLRGRARP